MHKHVVRFAVLAAAVALTACGSRDAASDRLEDLKEGMSRDSAVASMGFGPVTATGNDTLRLENGFRRQRFLIDGKEYEVIWARNEPGSVTEPIEENRETPVVIADGKVLGWGWKFYAQAMKDHKLPNPKQPVPASSAQQ